MLVPVVGYTGISAQKLLVSSWVKSESGSAKDASYIAISLLAENDVSVFGCSKAGTEKNIAVRVRICNACNGRVHE